MSQHRTIIFILITIVLILGVSYFGLKVYIEKEEKKLKAKALSENILEGVQLKPLVVEVDYSKKIADGSPLVFGLVQFPDSEEAWEKIAESGVTLLRGDLFLEYSLPYDITLEHYKNNNNNIRDPINWNESFINRRTAMFKNAKKYNIKTMGIMSYSPKWLTYSGNEHGIPKDWNIYEDIVKKMYKIYRGYTDYIQIWNEPTHKYFLDINKSPYSKEEAYNLLYKHASKAIREVDIESGDQLIPIVAQVSHSTVDTSVLSSLLSNKDVLPYINYLSYHNYGTKEPSWDNMLRVMDKYNFQVPLMLTEWNYDSEEKVPNENKIGLPALTYTSNKLLSFLQMGLEAANYYSAFPLEESNQQLGHGYLAYYKNTPQGVELLPQAKSWRLLSKSMSLGKGKSKIMDSTKNESLNSIGFINIYNIKGSVIVNNTLTTELIEFDLKHTEIKKRAKIEIYMSSEEKDGGSIIETRTVYPENGNLKFRYLLPENAVIGFKIYEEEHWYDFFDPIIKLNQSKSLISPV